MTKNILVLLFFLGIFISTNSCKREETHPMPARLEASFVLSKNSILLSFTSDIDKETSENILKYALAEQNRTKQELPISAELKNPRIVVLTFEDSFQKNTHYNLHIKGIKAKNGLLFNKEVSFPYNGIYKISLTEQIEATENTIKLVFSASIDEKEAKITTNYVVKNEKGEKLTPEKAEVKGKELLLTFKEKFTTGDYSIGISNLKFVKGFFAIDKESHSFIYVGNFKTKWVQITNMPLQVKGYRTDESKIYFSLTERRKNNFSKIDRWDIYFGFDLIWFSISANQEFYDRVGNENKRRNEGKVFGIDENIMNVKKVSDYQDIIDNVKFGEGSINIGGEKITADYRVSKTNPLYFLVPLFIKDVEDPYELKRKFELGEITLEEYGSIPFKVLPNKTILFKTIKGKYGKMELQSIYKDNKKPEKMTEGYIYHLTFRYVIQEDGSGNLDIPLDI